MTECTQDRNTIPVMAPRDAENRMVPLDTKVMYDDNGIEYEVSGLIFGTSKHGVGWDVECCTSDSDCIYTRPLDSMYIVRPDSWEKLEEDLSRAAKYDVVAASCRYFTAGKCADCRMHDGFTCGTHKTEWAFEDVLERIHNLRGDK